METAQRLPVKSLNFSHPCKSRLWEMWHPLFCYLATGRAVQYFTAGEITAMRHIPRCVGVGERFQNGGAKDARAASKHAFTHHGATTLAAEKCRPSYCG